jgi:hypothetical protein
MSIHIIALYRPPRLHRRNAHPAAGHARTDPQGSRLRQLRAAQQFRRVTDFTFVEEWASQAAIDAHMKTPTCTPSSPTPLSPARWTCVSHRLLKARCGGAGRPAAPVPPAKHAMIPAKRTPSDAVEPDEPAAIKEDRLWSDNGWTARVIKNEDDDGWAVAMIKDGEAEPPWSAPGPWGATKNPSPSTPTPSRPSSKPPRSAAPPRAAPSRHAAQAHHRERRRGPVEVTLDIVPDDYEPYAILSALDPFGEELARIRVEAASN